MFDSFAVLMWNFDDPKHWTSEEAKRLIHAWEKLEAAITGRPGWRFVVEEALPIYQTENQLLSVDVEINGAGYPRYSLYMNTTGDVENYDTIDSYETYHVDSLMVLISMCEKQLNALHN